MERRFKITAGPGIDFFVAEEVREPDGEQREQTPILGNSTSLSFLISQRIEKGDKYTIIFDNSVRLWVREDITKGLEAFSSPPR